MDLYIILQIYAVQLSKIAKFKINQTVIVVNVHQHIPIILY